LKGLPPLYKPNLYINTMVDEAVDWKEKIKRWDNRIKLRNKETI
jgi:hypothetical protein